MGTSSVWLLLLATGMLFGLGMPFSQLALQQGVDLLAFAVWPTALAAFGLATVALIRHGPARIDTRTIRFALVTGALGHALPAWAGYWLASQTGTGFAAIAYTLPPALTLGLTLLLRLERPVAGRIGAVALGLAGALLLVAGRGAQFDVDLVAMALLLVIPLSIASVNIYRARQLPRSVPPEWLAALMLASSAVVLATSSAFRGSLALPLDSDALLWPALQAVTLLGSYLLFFILQRRAEAVTISFVGYVSMVTGTGVAAIQFGEQLPLAAWPALGLIGGSVWLLKRSAASAPIGESTVAMDQACSNDHCAVSASGTMAFDCSATGLLPCA
jgi:drug/metabolite transporter (DMT)-like permease